jgi:hypothetical protein
MPDHSHDLSDETTERILAHLTLAHGITLAAEGSAEEHRTRAIHIHQGEHKGEGDRAYLLGAP